MNKVLFIAPRYLNIYKDVIKGLTDLGYNVDYIPEYSSSFDPLNLQRKGYVKFPIVLFDLYLNHYWEKLLMSDQYNKVYDILFVLDGQGINKQIFKILKDRNPSLKTINYLFDTTKGVYNFEKNFKYFDNIATFDNEEAETYSIKYLPIYWIDESDKPNYELDIFGLGAYSKSRYNFFSDLIAISKSCGLSYYIKLWTPGLKNLKIYKFKSKIRKLFNLKEHIPLSVYQSDITTISAINPKEFRGIIASSNIIVDSCAEHQVGLTARFMWALGLGKKIITTNKYVFQNSFCSTEQVFLYDMSSIINNADLYKFINNTAFIPDECKKQIEHFRIDNWLKFLLE